MIKVKGMCEQCGFCFVGSLKDMSHEVVCNRCGNPTQNYDESYVVDNLNKVESNNIFYKEVHLRTS